METWQIVVIIVLSIFIYFSVSYQIYKKLILIDPKKNYTVVNQTDAFFAPSWQWFQETPKENVHIRAYDGTRLSATFIPSIDKNSDLLAIVMHGYHANSTDMVLIAKMYSDLGFKVLLPDQRGHGSSSGTFTSFGIYEKYDLRQWINYCLRIYGSKDRILLHGVSMGAATILLASGMNMPENCKLVVADSAYTTFRRVLFHTMKPKLLVLFLPGVDLFTYWYHRFLLSKANVVKAVRHSTFPTIFIHSDHDKTTPPYMMNDLIKAMKKARTADYLVKDAPHGEGFVVDKIGLEKFVFEHLVEFFQFKRPKPKK